MNLGSRNPSQLNWMLRGAALGALAMFLLDPDKGRRRRALARDKMRSTAVRARKRINAKSRDLSNRARGLQAEIDHLFTRKHS